MDGAAAFPGRFTKRPYGTGNADGAGTARRAPTRDGRTGFRGREGVCKLPTGDGVTLAPRLRGNDMGIGQVRGSGPPRGLDRTGL